MDIDIVGRLIYLLGGRRYLRQRLMEAERERDEARYRAGYIVMNIDESKGMVIDESYR